MAPEVADIAPALSPLQAKKYCLPKGFYTDLWYLGVLAFEILTGVKPFENTQKKLTISEVYMKIENKEFFPEGFDPHAKDLICMLMRLNPIERLGFTMEENKESFPKEKRLENKEIDKFAETYMNYLRNLKSHPFLEVDII